MVFRPFWLIVLLLGGSGFVEALEAETVQPTFPANQVLMRSVQIDGVVADREYTPAYAIKTPDGDASIGIGWDSRNLSFSVDGPALARVVIYIDAMADGWLNGTDNYEITIDPTQTPPAVQPRLYNSFVSSPDRALAPAILDHKVAASSSPARTMVEISLARNKSTGMVYENRKRIAFGVAVYLVSDPEKSCPPDARASMQTVDLVHLMAARLQDLDLSVLFRDRTLVPGQGLSLDFFADNRGDTPITYQYFQISGDDQIAEKLNVLRVRGGTIEPGKRVKQGYATDLPKDMALGAYVIDVDMPLEDGTLASLRTSFEVVDFFETRLDLGSGPLRPGEERRLAVIIRNNRPGVTSGDVRLIVPEAIDRGLDRNRARFNIRLTDSDGRLEFRYRVPNGTPAGEYTIAAEATSGGVTQTVEGVILIAEPR